MFNPYSPYVPQIPQQAQYQPSQPFFPAGVPQPVQSQNKAPAVLYAPTAKDFGSVSLQPGTQALIIAQNEPFMAFKAADNMGMVQTTIYRIEQVTEQDIAAPAPEYATKGELAQLQQVVQQIIDGLQPKRTTKKEAATE